MPHCVLDYYFRAEPVAEVVLIVERNEFVIIRKYRDTLRQMRSDCCQVKWRSEPMPVGLRHADGADGSPWTRGGGQRGEQPKLQRIR